MILGRNRALWVALLGAFLNAVVVLGIIRLTSDQIASIDALGLAIIGIIANASDPTTVPTFALTRTPSQSTTPTAPFQGK